MPATEAEYQSRHHVPARQPTAIMPRAQEERPQRLVKRYRTEIAASTSSMFSTVVAFPLDSVKTRMQTYRYEGFLDCVRHTYRTEKLRGFFRVLIASLTFFRVPPSVGVLAPMASITLVRTMSFSIYQRAKYSYSGWIKNALGFDVVQHVNKKGTYPNLYSIACFGAAGATAGSCITLLACPFELTKLSAQVSVLLSDQQKLKEANCRATNGHQVAASYQNKGTFKTMRNIIRHRGALGLYTGFNLHLLRDTLGTAIYFMVYESGKQLGTTFGGDHPTTNKLSVVISGGLCGIVSWAMIYPIDSAKSIYQRNSLLYSKGQQVEPPPKIEFFKRHMYRGLGVSMGRSCAVNAIFFSAFEFMKKHVNSLDDN
ncbi:Mitochondrial carrier protein [Colletotrichum higginsianum IMI 349063]|uniref:Mitochondrial carrier protein n=1 Tax=Colletotrichum higginsianum (strain IMI 349063) TaxID=759273 RepID=A0A1B7XV71_COLHI|nr:Mitochondrial carrier protein [Colletotrichum higginsianum IMI 349063]OBR03643.1 Mitochondrial carrier protein [Colletotrichum higginsianum IMI 349063]